MQERQGIIRVSQRAEASFQEGRPSSLPSRSTGPSPMSHTSSNTPFKEQQLKQLRAQCLVFLAFRSAFLFVYLFLVVVSLSISRLQSMASKLHFVVPMSAAFSCRNNLRPRKVHLEIALGRGPPAESKN